MLLDIEGTTTPISFVHDTLFGYVKDNLKEYLSTRWENEEVQEDVEALRKQAVSDKEAAVEGVVDVAAKEEEQDKGVQSVIDNVLWQMEADRKSTSLKQLQGHMWRDAYKTGKVQGEVFDDVIDAFKSLKSSDTKVYIYSSGSVEAQKLLFGYSEKGDLNEFIAGYFDTTSGAKTEKDSYTAIAAEIGVNASEVLFLTDLPREAGPASEANMKVAVVVRDGNTALTDEEKAAYATIKSLAELSGAAEEADDEPPAKKAATEDSNGAAAAATEEEEEELDEDDLGDVDEEDVGEEDDEEAAEEAS